MMSEEKAKVPLIPRSEDPKEEVLKDRMQRSLPCIPILLLNCVLFCIACYTSIEKIFAEDAYRTLHWSIFCLAISAGFIAHLKLLTTADFPKPTKGEIEFRNKTAIFFFGIMVLALPISLHNKLNWYSMCIAYAGLVVLMVSVAALESPTEKDAHEGSSEAKTHLMQYPLSWERMVIILMYISASIILAIALSHINNLFISAMLLLLFLPLFSVSHYKSTKTDELSNGEKKWWRRLLFLCLTIFILLCVPLMSPSLVASAVWQALMVI